MAQMNDLVEKYPTRPKMRIEKYYPSMSFDAEDFPGIEDAPLGEECQLLFVAVKKGERIEKDSMTGKEKTRVEVEFRRGMKVMSMTAKKESPKMEKKERMGEGY